MIPPRPATTAVDADPAPDAAAPICTVQRAALAALVARLQARGFRHVVTAEGSPYGR